MGFSGAKFSNNCTQVINAFPTNSRSLWRTVGRNTSNKMARFVPNFDEFDSLTLFGICQQFTENIPDTIAWCWRNGLLVRRLLCENCHIECIEGALNKSLDGVTWRCPQCRKRFNGQKGSFFRRLEAPAMANNSSYIFLEPRLWTRSGPVAKADPKRTRHQK